MFFNRDLSLTNTAQIYREMRSLIQHLRHNLQQLSENSEEIEFRQNQIKRILKQQEQKNY